MSNNTKIKLIIYYSAVYTCNSDRCSVKKCFFLSKYLFLEH